MSSVSPDITHLLQSLDTLSLDSRLASIFRSKPAQLCTFTFWLLEIEYQGKREHRLLFGWIVPKAVEKFNTWSFTSLKRWQANSCKFQIHRVSFQHYGQTILSVIKQLCQGASLAEACTVADINIPKRTFKDFCFAGSVHKIAESFEVCPITFLDTAWHNQLTKSLSIALASPASNAPAFVGTLFYKRKLDLFEHPTSQNAQDRDEIAKKCLLHLHKETGLNFCATDIARLGNLEWICCPSLDQNGTAQVLLTVTQECEVTIEIQPNTLPIGTSCLIQCQGQSEGVTVFARSRLIVITPGTTCVTFTAPEATRIVTATIWQHDLDSGEGELWYQDSILILQKINFNQGVASSKMRLSSRWLQECERNSRVRERAEAAQEIQQIHYTSFSVSSQSPSAWIIATHEAREFAQTLFPVPSGGKFFPKDWTGDEFGRLSFSEWLQTLAKNPTTARIVLLDPFFDESGIAEFIARVSTAQTEYIVVTNTTAASREGPEKLQAACQKHHFLLRNLNFQLLDLCRKAGGTDQIFHDRYIFVFDTAGKACQGYHLSNSIQGATKRHPLLITPIPADILPNVYCYVEQLIHPNDSATWETVQLFSSIEKNNSSIAPRFGLASLSDAKAFFALLLQNQSLALEQTDLADYLREQGLLDENDDFVVTSEASDHLKAAITQFAKTLTSLDRAMFSGQWSDFSHWLRHLVDELHSHYLEQVCKVSCNGLMAQLHLHLLEESYSLPFIAAFNSSHQMEALTIVDTVQGSFEETIRQAHVLFFHTDPHSWTPCLNDQGVQAAAEVFLKVEPSRLVPILSALLALLDALAAEDREKYQAWSIRYRLSRLVQSVLAALELDQRGFQPNEALVIALLQSDIPGLRAIAAFNLSPLRSRSLTWQRSYRLLENLPLLEQLYAFAEWIYQIRIQENVRPENSEKLKALRLSIFQQMVQVSPGNLSNATLKQVVCQASGPIVGSWARSTAVELLKPFVQSGKLNANQVSDTWMSILYRPLKQLIADPQPQALNVISNTLSREGEELIGVAAEALLASGREERERWTEELVTLHRSAKRIAEKPFAQADESRWANAQLCLARLDEFVEWLFLNSCLKTLETRSMWTCNRYLLCFTSTILNTKLVG
ncbi:MAG: hypothetical protein KME13_13055 [Myxacorys californica WJT36-NPBG1]|jgi:hypothetical protein|nr:hypothetical protein [Myxacorys californica WJT36-NPBG1]